MPPSIRVHVPIRQVCETGACGSDTHLDLTTCYSCGLHICRGPDCSGMVRYRLARNRWVRMCASCIEDRASWGELTDNHCPHLMPPPTCERCGRLYAPGEQCTNLACNPAVGVPIGHQPSDAGEGWALVRRWHYYEHGRSLCGNHPAPPAERLRPDVGLTDNDCRGCTRKLAARVIRRDR